MYAAELGRLIIRIPSPPELQQAASNRNADMENNRYNPCNCQIPSKLVTTRATLGVIEI